MTFKKKIFFFLSFFILFITCNVSALSGNYTVTEHNDDNTSIDVLYWYRWKKNNSVGFTLDNMDLTTWHSSDNQKVKYRGKTINNSKNQYVFCINPVHSAQKTVKISRELSHFTGEHKTYDAAVIYILSNGSTNYGGNAENKKNYIRKEQAIRMITAIWGYENAKDAPNTGYEYVYEGWDLGNAHAATVKNWWTNDADFQNKVKAVGKNNWTMNSSKYYPCPTSTPCRWGVTLTSASGKSKTSDKKYYIWNGYQNETPTGDLATIKTLVKGALTNAAKYTDSYIKNHKVAFSQTSSTIDRDARTATIGLTVTNRPSNGFLRIDSVTTNNNTVTVTSKPTNVTTNNITLAFKTSSNSKQTFKYTIKYTYCYTDTNFCKTGYNLVGTGATTSQRLLTLDLDATQPKGFTGSFTGSVTISKKPQCEVYNNHFYDKNMAKLTGTNAEDNYVKSCYSGTCTIYSGAEHNELTKDHYFGKSGQYTNKTTYDAECNVKKCQKVGSDYYGKNGNKITKGADGKNPLLIFLEECYPRTCDTYKYNNIVYYFGSSGQVVNKEGYDDQCSCKKVNGVFHDKDGDIVDDEESFVQSCYKGPCQVVDTSILSRRYYFGINPLTLVDEETYTEECINPPPSGKSPCPTEINIKGQCSDNQTDIAPAGSIKTLDKENGDTGGDIDYCIIDNHDEAGNSYELSNSFTGISEENNACKVYCKENYSVAFDGIKHVNSGRYFKFGAEIEDDIVCYITNIDFSNAANASECLSAPIKMYNAYVNHSSDQQLNTISGYEYNSGRTFEFLRTDVTNSEVIYKYSDELFRGGIVEGQDMKEMTKNLQDTDVTFTITGCNAVNSSFECDNPIVYSKTIDGSNWAMLNKYKEAGMSLLFNLRMKNIKIEITAKAKYSTANQYYNQYPFGSIKYNNDGSNNLMSVEGAPIKITTPTGFYPYNIRLQNLGNYYYSPGENGNYYGRIIGGQGSIVDMKSEKGTSVNQEYVCYYMVNCPRCTAVCVGEDGGDCTFKFCDPDQENVCYDPGECPTCNPRCDNCIYGKEDLKTHFRPVSTLTVNPNERDLGYNWNSQTIVEGSEYTILKAEKTIKEIEENADKVYDEEPILSVQMTPQMIKQISEYNKDQESQGGYTNNTLSCYDYNKTINGEKVIYENVMCYSDYLDTLMSDEAFSKNFTTSNRTAKSSRTTKNETINTNLTNSAYWTFFDESTVSSAEISNFAGNITMPFVYGQEGTGKIGGPSWK